jgi:hypothetical protein
MDDLGRLGPVWREADAGAADLEAVILDLLQGQFKSPIRVVAFNTAEHWSQDVSADVAQELRRRCDLQQRDIPFFLQDFVDRYEGRYHDIQLPLPIRLVLTVAFQRKKPPAIGVKAPYPGFIAPAASS